MNVDQTFARIAELQDHLMYRITAYVEMKRLNPYKPWAHEMARGDVDSVMDQLIAVLEGRS